MTLQAQKQDLLNVVTKLAAWHIEHGGFIPFGAVLGPGRSIKVIKPKSWKENADREEVEAYWARKLGEASCDTGGKLVCWCSAVGASWDGSEFVPCVLIHVEQAEASSEDIFYPYGKTEDCQVVFGPPKVVTTSFQVFGPAESVN